MTVDQASLVADGPFVSGQPRPRPLAFSSLLHENTVTRFLSANTTRHRHGPAAPRARRGAGAHAAGGRDRRAGQARALAVALVDAAGSRGRDALLMTETAETNCSGQAARLEAAASCVVPSQMMKMNRSQMDDASGVVNSTSADVIPEEAPVLLNVDVADVQVADQVAPDITAVIADENTDANDTAARGGAQVNPVRRRSMQLPAPLLMKMLGDASSPSLSATESEDDEEEPTLTRSFTSSTSSSPPTSGRKIRPRSSSSSSGFSVANRKRLVGSPVCQPQLYLQPHPQSSTSSSSSSSSPATARPNGMMTPVRNRRAATVTSHPSSGSSKSQTSSSSSNGLLNKRNAFARRSAASERELMAEKMAADGYWIGDFRLERQLVTRRSFLSKDGGNGSGNNSARSSPRAV